MEPNRTTTFLWRIIIMIYREGGLVPTNRNVIATKRAMTYIKDLH
jgi:hypothetical protein